MREDSDAAPAVSAAPTAREEKTARAGIAEVAELVTGALVLDTRTDRVGVVMGREGPYVQVRPPAGGTEWDAPPSALRPAGPSDRVRAEVARVNAEGRWGR